MSLRELLRKKSSQYELLAEWHVERAPLNNDHMVACQAMAGGGIVLREVAEALDSEWGGWLSGEQGRSLVDDANDLIDHWSMPALGGGGGGNRASALASTTGKRSKVTKEQRPIDSAFLCTPPHGSSVIAAGSSVPPMNMAILGVTS